MSFAKLDKKASNTPRSSPVISKENTNDAFNKYNKSVSEKMTRYEKHVKEISRLTPLLGTMQDTEQFREKLHVETAQGTKLGTEITKDLQSFSSLANENNITSREKSDRQNQISKLAQQFKKLVANFQSAVKISLMKQEQSVSNARKVLEDKSASGSVRSSKSLDSNEENGLDTALLKHDSLSSEITINEMIIVEREEEIQKIQDTVIEINAIFKDLAVIVNDQGSQIESIDSNITEAASNAEKGLKELHSAAKSQNASRGKMACLMITLLAITGALVLGLFVFNK